jgi:two-component sensor histidine kinase
MNIVTSLLNLKKNASVSSEAKDALEECKNRVYSMALVHQHLYKTNRFTNLDLKEYIHDLLDELIESNGAMDLADVSVKCSDVSLDLSQAIPFGLILNELVTNSFKYAIMPDRKLKISIQVSETGKAIQLQYHDNGPGIKEERNNKNSLGLDLIKSLSEQLDGKFEFDNQNGFEFSLRIVKP